MDKTLPGPRSASEPTRSIEIAGALRKQIVAAAATLSIALSACGSQHVPSVTDSPAAEATTPVVETSAPSSTNTATVSRPNAAAAAAAAVTADATSSATTTSPTTLFAAKNTVETLINDMALNNDLRLAGIPLERGWATGTGFVFMGNDPRGTRTASWWNPANTYYKSAAWWTHIVPWMVIFDGVGNAATNTRVELRQLKAYYKSRSTGQWVLLSQGAIEGQNYPKYLNAVTAGDPDIRSLGGGTVSVLPPPTELHFHGWCCGRALPDPTDIAAIHITTQARLAVNDPNRPDDRAAARYLVQVGGDYYPDASLNVAAFAPDSWNPGIGLSRSKLVGNTWQSYSFTTINVGAQVPGGASISVEELRAAPPPLD